jgi:hypothetical protein
VLVKQAGQAVAAYASEVVAMLEVAVGDSYYEVNLEACAAVESLTGRGSVHQWRKGISCTAQQCQCHKMF